MCGAPASGPAVAIWAGNEKAPAQAHGAEFPNPGEHLYTCAGPCTAELRSMCACTHADDRRSLATDQVTRSAAVPPNRRRSPPRRPPVPSFPRSRRAGTYRPSGHVPAARMVPARTLWYPLGAGSRTRGARTPGRGRSAVRGCRRRPAGGRDDPPMPGRRSPIARIGGPWCRGSSPPASSHRRTPARWSGRGRNSGSVYFALPSNSPHAFTSSSPKSR